MMPPHFGGYMPTRTLQDRMIDERVNPEVLGAPSGIVVALIAGSMRYVGPYREGAILSLRHAAQEEGERFQVWEDREMGSALLMDEKWDHRPRPVKERGR